MKKNRKSMKKKVLATVLAAVCAVSAIGAASAVSVGAASVSASSSVGASGKACRFDMYGTSWSYRTSMGYVAVSCNYDWRTQHAQFTIKGVSAENGNVELPEVVLVAGDVNEDGKINIQDMGTFRAEFGKTGDAIGNDYTDVNEDGKVNIQDMGTFRANFGKTAEKDCTVEYGA